MKLLITAGPTREPLDPVRFLGNRLSGKVDYAWERLGGLRPVGDRAYNTAARIAFGWFVGRVTSRGEGR